jgi:hypothetical protein
MKMIALEKTSSLPSRQRQRSFLSWRKTRTDLAPIQTCSSETAEEDDVTPVTFFDRYNVTVSEVPLEEEDENLLNENLLNRMPEEERMVKVKELVHLMEQAELDALVTRAREARGSNTVKEEDQLEEEKEDVIVQRQGSNITEEPVPSLDESKEESDASKEESDASSEPQQEEEQRQQQPYEEYLLPLLESLKEIPTTVAKMFQSEDEKDKTPNCPKTISIPSFCNPAKTCPNDMGYSPSCVTESFASMLQDYEPYPWDENPNATQKGPETKDDTIINDQPAMGCNVAYADYQREHFQTKMGECQDFGTSLVKEFQGVCFENCGLDLTNITGGDDKATPEEFGRQLSKELAAESSKQLAAESSLELKRQSSV